MAKKVTHAWEKWEKPSYHSRQVQLSQKRNEWETVVLKKSIRELERQRVFERVLKMNEKDKLRQDMVKISKIRKSAPVSPERKMFLAKNGLKADEKYYDMADLISVIDRHTSSGKRRETTNPDDRSYIPFDDCDIGDVYSPNMPININCRKSKKEGNICVNQSEESKTQFMNDKMSDSDSESRDIGNDICEVKETRQYNSSVTCVKKSKPPWIFREIEPPLKGRFLGNRLKFKSIKPQTCKPVENVKENLEDDVLREKANDYRYQLLCRHKLRSQFIPITSLDYAKKTNIGKTKMAELPLPCDQLSAVDK